MHIPKDKPLKNKILFVVALLVCLSIGFGFWQSVGQIKLETLAGDQTIETATVKVGQFEHTIAAFGVLKSSAERVIMSRVDGTINQLHVRPGAVVQTGQVIVSLTNSAIVRDLADAAFELEAAQAQASLQQAALEEQELKLRNAVQMAQADLDIFGSELSAHKKLAERKIISQFDYEKVKLQLKKNQLRYQLIKQQLDNFVNNKPVRQRADEFELIKAKRRLAVAESDHGALQVTAGMQGVLKSIADEIQLGTWLTKDRKIGVVTDITALYAELEVNAAEAVSLRIGMSVLLNVKGQNIEGDITRIAPNVVNNRVQIDAKLTSPLPQTARPDVEVNANILAQQIPNTLILPRPAWLNIQNGKALLYVKSGNAQGYQKRTVTIGATSRTTMQVLEGLKPNEQVIMSNTSDWVHQEVQLKG
jgi:HlyD family secretion protein